MICTIIHPQISTYQAMEYIWKEIHFPNHHVGYPGLVFGGCRFSIKTNGSVPAVFSAEVFPRHLHSRPPGGCFSGGAVTIRYCCGSLTMYTVYMQTHVVINVSTKRCTLPETNSKNTWKWMLGRCIRFIRSPYCTSRETRYSMGGYLYKWGYNPSYPFIFGHL